MCAIAVYVEQGGRKIERERERERDREKQRVRVA